MENFRDLTINIKKSIDREYVEDLQPNFDDDQKMLNDDNLISSIEKSYDDDYEDDIIVDHSYDDDFIIAPDEPSNIDTIRLVKVKTIDQLDDELDTIDKTRVPLIVDFDYIQKRRKSELKDVGDMLNKFKQATDAKVVLLGSTKNVVVIVPSEIVLLKS